MRTVERDVVGGGVLKTAEVPPPLLVEDVETLRCIAAVERVADHRNSSHVLILTHHLSSRDGECKGINT